MNILLLKELEVAEVPKTEFVCKLLDELLLPNKLTLVVVALPNKELLDCDVGLLKTKAEDVLPS